jgi:hypothetical protein
MAKKKTAEPTNGHAEPRQPIRYTRRVPKGGISLDPARNTRSAPPNFDRSVVPHVLTFSAIASSIAKVYRNPDEAVKNSLDNARFMRNDCFIWECLQERQLGVSLLNWHIEPEDKKSELQKELVTDMTAIVAETRSFTEYRRNLSEAVWYGRYGIQNRYALDYRTGRRRVIVEGWTPVHGDKLAFRFDDGTGNHDPNEVGIRVGTSGSKDDAIAGDRIIEYTDFGMAYFLEPWERALVTLHKHTIEDAAYEDYLGAGSIHGIGIRSRIYWTWLQMQETMAQLMELIERTGQGIYVYWFPEGNKAAQTQMEGVAKNQAHTNSIIMPRSPSDPEAYDIQQIPPNTAGIDALKAMVIDIFARRIKLCILGQELTSEAHAMGIGSGGAETQRETGNRLIRYDASALEESLTHEFLKPLQHFNRPSSRNVFLRFRIDTEDDNADKIMARIRDAWDIGARIEESKVLEICSLGEPTGNSRILQNPAMMQQARLFQQSQMAQGGQQPGGMSIEDLFGPLAPKGSEEPGSEGGQPPGPDAGPNPPESGPPQQMSRRRPVRYKFGDGTGMPKLPGEENLQPGATKTGPSGNELRLNDNHRWELANKEASENDEGGRSAPTPSNREIAKETGIHKGAIDRAEAIDKKAAPELKAAKGETTGEQPGAAQQPGAELPKEWLDDKTVSQRQQTAAKNLGSVDKQVGGLIRAFHESPDYKQGGQMWSKDVHPKEFDRTYKWLQQNVGKDAGGGKVVDLGNGRLGFSSAAGAIALMPAAGTDPTAKPQVSYTVNTRPVHEAGANGGDGLEPVEQVPAAEAPPVITETGQATPAQEQPNVSPAASQAVPVAANGGTNAAPPNTPAEAAQPPSDTGQPGAMASGADSGVEQVAGRITPKQPHEMTRAEFAKTNLATRHKAEIKKALAEGKTVPPEVLADYPELAKMSGAGKDREDGGNAREAAGAESEPSEATHEDLRKTATLAQQRLKRAIAQQNALIKSGGDPVASKALRAKVKELRAQHKEAHRAASEAEHEATKDSVTKVLNPVLKPEEQQALKDMGFTPEHIVKMLAAEKPGQETKAKPDISHVKPEHVDAWKKLGANDEQIAKMFPKGTPATAPKAPETPAAQPAAEPAPKAEAPKPAAPAKPQEPADTPDGSSAILRVAGRSGVGAQLDKAKLKDAPETRRLIENAIARGEITDAKHLDRVLKSVSTKRGKGTTANDHQAIERAIKANSKAANKQKPEELIAEEAERNDLTPDELKEALAYVEKEEGANAEERGEREAAKATARKLTGLTAKDIARFENQHKDHASAGMPQFDQWADEIKSQYPGAGIETAADLWDLIKEGAIGSAQKLSPEKIARAAKLAKEHREYLATRKTRSEEDESLPFAKSREGFAQKSPLAQEVGELPK